MTPRERLAARQRPRRPESLRPEAGTAPFRPRHEGRTNVRSMGDPPLGVTPLRGAEVNRRLLALMVIIVLAAGGMIFRLVQLQILSPERYVEQGLAQRTRAIELPGPRGEILDRNGNRLAISIPQKTFFIDPKFVTDPGAAAEALAPVLNQDPAALYEKFTANSRFVYLARQVPDDLAHAVEALSVPGVYSLEEPTRFNPAGGDLGGSFIGRVGIDSQPLSGLEYKYDDILAGVPGQMVVEKNPAGQTIPMGPRELQPASPGSDLVLTIDRSLQFEVEQLLMAQVEDMVAKGGIAIVTETRTGEILAMASATRDTELNVVLSSENLAANWAYEPGSVMKAITFAAVLDAGLAEPTTARTVPWTFDLYDQRFSDHDPHEPQEWTVSDIVTQSSNVGSVLWATDLGARNFDPYIRAFGMTDPVLGLAGETSGLLEEVDDWDGTKIGAVALGQAISISGLQMIQAFNVIANDGIAVPLTLVEGTVTPDGERVDFETEQETERIVSAEVAGQMRAILRNVVVAGTGQAAAVEGYEVAGKTGTARKPLPTGGYQDAAGNYHYVSSFVGFLPANDPEISILVTIDEPVVSQFASEVAAPLFADIAHYSLRHFSIPPSAKILPAVPLSSDIDLTVQDGIVATQQAPLPEPEVIIEDSSTLEPLLDDAVEQDPAGVTDQVDVAEPGAAESGTETGAGEDAVSPGPDGAIPPVYVTQVEPGTVNPVTPNAVSPNAESPPSDQSADDLFVPLDVNTSNQATDTSSAGG